MYYSRDYKNDSPYVSVNTLIKPKKSSHRDASSPDTTFEQNRPVLGAGVHLATSPSKLEISKPNDPAEIEADRVADQIGAIDQCAVTSPQPIGYRSPALQMRSQLRTLSFLNPKLIIQRKVNTWGGEWDTDKYDLAKDKDMSGNPTSTAWGMRGVDITLKFTPNDNVNAELIGLTQSVQAFVNNKPNLTPAASTRAIPSTDAIKIKTGPGETDEGTAIDRASPYNNPIYPVETNPSKSLDDTNTWAGWGQNGWHFKDAKGSPQHQNATLIDAPRRSNATKDSRHIFETTALATKGAQKGTYYGSVRWGWRTDDKGIFSKIDLVKVSDGVPSSTFMKSAEIWNASKTSTGANTIDLPIVDVKVTTAPITGVYPPGFIGPPLQIPSGTRIQILRRAKAPKINGQIKVIDGYRKHFGSCSGGHGENQG
ncbi:MAG TPA: hypothetical protein VHY08_07935 [Bacillota bacterium]|nr:hypothetical protein [Bacillota bacterium]